MASEAPGDIARQAAAAPVVPKSKLSPIMTRLLSVLGEPKIVRGDGKTYPRQIGFGANKKTHPDGGTNETALFVVFSPFKGLDLPLEARVYCEKWNDPAINKTRVKYSISVPFLKPGSKRDADANGAVAEMKAYIKGLVQAAQRDGSIAAIKATAVTESADTWEVAAE